MTKAVKLKLKFDRGDDAARRYRVTLFMSEGFYPQGTFCTPNGIFHADPDVVFAVTFGVPWQATSEHLPYSEVDWLLPEVVRLLGSLIMTERLTGMRNRFYPLAHGGFTLNEHFIDLTRPQTALAVKRALLRTIGSPLWRHHAAKWEACRTSDFLLFDPHELCIDDYQRCWLKISTENHLLMRGLQALIKSDMLVAHDQFYEEATIATFIALDASFEMVLRHLRATGRVKPSAQDAGDWLYTVFEEPLGQYGAEGMKYFEEAYTQRIQTIHPGSRLGDVPFAPLMAEDYIHLRASLPAVFAYLTLGEHLPDFHREVAERLAERERPVPPCESMS